MSVDGRLRNDLSRDASRVDVDVDRFLDSVVTGGRRRQRVRRVVGVMAVAALIAVVGLATPAVLDAIRHGDQPAAAVPAAIEGTYVVRIGPSDVRGTPRLDVEGLWQLTVRGDGLLSLAGPRGSSVSAPSSQYQLDGERILTTAFASEQCSGVGVYRWQREGSTLTFTLESDACAVRVEVLTSHPWEKR
jgi:hypothetical protein